MREAGRVVSVAVTIAVAVNDQGRREVLGMAVGASELLDRVPALPGPRRQAGGLTTRGSRLTRVLGATALPRPLHAQSACPCRQARPSSPPSSPSPKRMLTAPPHSGARSPTSSGPRCRSSPLSWTTHDVLAYMTFPAAHHLHSTNPMPQWRDQAAHQHHLPQRRSHHTADRRHPARAKRRMGRPEGQIHDAGINRSHERQYNRRAA